MAKGVAMAAKGLAKGWKTWREAQLPSTVKGWALELGPDALYAGMYGASVLGQGGNMGDALAVGGSDFLIQMAANRLGRGAATGIALKTAKKGTGSHALRNRMDEWGNWGTFAAGMPAGMLPNPAQNAMFERQQKDYEAQMNALPQAQQQMVQGMPDMQPQNPVELVSAVRTPEEYYRQQYQSMIADYLQS